MTPYEFLLTIYGIVVAISVSRLLNGTASLIASWKLNDVNVFYVSWILLLLSFQLGWWFSLWTDRQDSAISLLQFIGRFHVPALFYVATHLTIPSENSDFEGLYRNHRAAFICAAIPLFVGPSIAVLGFGALQFLALTAVGILLVSGVVVRNIRYHQIMTTCALVTYVTFIAIYRSNVGG